FFRGLLGGGFLRGGLLWRDLFGGGFLRGGFLCLRRFHLRLLRFRGGGSCLRGDFLRKNRCDREGLGRREGSGGNGDLPCLSFRGRCRSDRCLRMRLLAEEEETRDEARENGAENWQGRQPD